VDKAQEGSAVSYQIQVSEDIGFAEIVVDVSDLILPQYENTMALPDSDTLYYRVRAYDAVGNSAPFTTPRRFFTTPAYLCGDADSNDLVSISDAVFLIAYIFSGGPAPSPLASGDVDCSGIVNISDAVYLIGYIFGGGPAPCAAC
jgi:hypothetical protein